MRLFTALSPPPLPEGKGWSEETLLEVDKEADSELRLASVTEASPLPAAGKIVLCFESRPEPKAAGDDVSGIDAILRGSLWL